MSKKTKQWYRLTEEQLWRLVGQSTYLGAEQELKRVRKITDAGHTPAIYYSEFSGFRVIDEDDPEQFKIGLSIRNRAKRFQM